jgi:hypothetical protein
MAFQQNFARTMSTLGPLASSAGMIPGPHSPYAMAAGGIMSALGSLLNQPEQYEDPNADIRQQLIQQMQAPTPEIDLGGLQGLLRQQYFSDILPGIAERFTGLGGQRSSAFGQELGAAGAAQMGQLAAMMPQLQMQRQQLEQSRMGSLGGLLSGERQFGMQQQQFGAAQQEAQQQQFLDMLSQTARAAQQQQQFEAQLGQRRSETDIKRGELEQRRLEAQERAAARKEEMKRQRVNAKSSEVFRGRR